MDVSKRIILSRGRSSIELTWRRLAPRRAFRRSAAPDANSDANHRYQRPASIALKNTLNSIPHVVLEHSFLLAKQFVLPLGKSSPSNALPFS
jgi:hypothetical protein